MLFYECLHSFTSRQVRQSFIYEDDQKAVAKCIRDRLQRIKRSREQAEIEKDKDRDREKDKDRDRADSENKELREVPEKEPEKELPSKDKEARKDEVRDKTKEVERIPSSREASRQNSMETDKIDVKAHPEKVPLDVQQRLEAFLESTTPRTGNSPCGTVDEKIAVDTEKVWTKLSKKLFFKQFIQINAAGNLYISDENKLNVMGFLLTGYQIALYSRLNTLKT